MWQRLRCRSDVLDGYNGTVFAYGQTGSGKTFTMMVRVHLLQRSVADRNISHRVPTSTHPSLLVSSRVSQNKSSSRSSSLTPTSSTLSRSLTWRSTSSASAIFSSVRQIYYIFLGEWCTEIHVFYYTAQNDNLQVHEEKSRGVYVKNLSDYYVSNASEVYEIMRQGGNARVVSSTSESKSR